LRLRVFAVNSFAVNSFAVNALHGWNAGVWSGGSRVNPLAYL